MRKRLIQVGELICQLHPAHCPAAPAKVYDRSNPLGPSIFISQFSLPPHPVMDTCHSPGLSLRACSMRATISRHSSASPVFRSSVATPMNCNFIQRDPLPSCQCKQVKPACISTDRSRSNLSRLPQKTQTRPAAAICRREVACS
jgi:hypothetical protein